VYKLKLGSDYMVP